LFVTGFLLWYAGFMKTAGDILSALFDKRFVEKARGYSKFFDSWTDITAKNGIAAAGDHSQIKDLDRGVVLIEIDHPGWKQVLQTKQSKLLNDFRIRFPTLDISGISLMLGNGKPRDTAKESEPAYKAEVVQRAEDTQKPEPARKDEPAQETDAPAAAEAGKETGNSAVSEEPVARGYEAIKDEVLREKLISIGRKIAEEEKRKF
jgi:hypothetical protein